MSRRRTSYGPSKPLPGVRAVHRSIPNASAAWLFNETGGTLARDALGNDNATVVGSAVVRGSGANGGWGAFSGFTSASYLTTTKSPTAAYTLVARFKTAATGDYPNLFSAVGTAYVLHIVYLGTFNLWSSTEFAAGTYIGPTLTANRWYTMAFTRAGSSVTNGYSLYYDGLLAGQANTGSLAAPTNPMWIGMRSDGYPQPWDGSIDYLMWFERCLTAAEIRQLYHDPFRAWGEPGPRLYRVPVPAAAPITGEASLTQGADSLSAAGTVAVAGAAAITQTRDSVSGAGTVAVGGSSALTQGADGSTAAGAVAVVGASAVSQGADSTSGAGAVSIAGAAGLTESGNTASGTGGTSIGGSAGLTQAADTLTSAGAASVAGAALPTQDANTVTSAGVVLIGGAGVPVQAGDAVASVGTVSIAATLSVVGSLNTLVATGLTGSVSAPLASWYARTQPTAWQARLLATSWWANRTGLTWRAGMSDHVNNVLTKTPGDLLWRYAMDLSELPQVRAGATIASVTSVAASPSGLTIASSQVDTGSKSASATFGGGTADTDYAVTFTVVLSTGETVARTGTLKVST